MGKKANKAKAEAGPAEGGTEEKRTKRIKLWDDGDGEEGTAELRVSEKFAAKYNAQKDQQELVRAKRILEDEGLDGKDSDESTSEPEDENAELLTPSVDTKIFETLHKIKSRDPSIYKPDTVFFTDKDFQKQAKAEKQGSTSKPVRYKDHLRKTLLEGGADAAGEEEDALEAKSKRKTPLQEQQEMKAQIRAAAHAAAGEEAEDDDDDLFTIKEKSEQDLKREEEDFAAFNFKKGGMDAGGDADDIMTRYWKSDEDLNEEERFLRDFMLNKGWLDSGSLQNKEAGFSDSEQEEEHLDKADDFEQSYNFRFEMEEGTQIQGHSRIPVDSVRHRDVARKRQREEKAKRQEADKIRRTEEIKRLKKLKQQEIQRRLKQIQEVTGNEETALGAIDLDADFDPDRFDKEMEGVLGNDYDEKDEALGEEELLQVTAGVEELQATTEAEQAAKGRRRRGQPDRVGEEEAADDGDEEGSDGEEAADDAGEEDADEEADPNEWWLCDSCQKPILPGKKRFDCSVCEDYTLCMDCFRIRRHPHKFMRRRVPTTSVIPDDYETPAAASNPEVEKLMDDYYNLDYEDIIGGDLPVRFKYRKVEPNDFGLNAEKIFKLSDQELNRIVPLKKLRTYNTDTGGAAWDQAGDSWEDWRQGGQHRRGGGGSEHPRKRNKGGGGAGESGQYAAGKAADARAAKGSRSSGGGTASDGGGKPAATSGPADAASEAASEATKATKRPNKPPRNRGKQAAEKKRRAKEDGGLTKQRLGAYSF